MEQNLYSDLAYVGRDRLKWKAKQRHPYDKP